MATVIQLIYLKLSSCKRTSSEQLKQLWLFSKSKENTTDLYQRMYCYSTLFLL